MAAIKQRKRQGVRLNRDDGVYALPSSSNKPAGSNNQCHPSTGEQVDEPGRYDAVISRLKEQAGLSRSRRLGRSTRSR